MPEIVRNHGLDLQPAANAAAARDLREISYLAWRVSRDRTERREAEIARLLGSRPRVWGG